MDYTKVLTSRTWWEQVIRLIEHSDSPENATSKIKRVYEHLHLGLFSI